MSEAEHQEFEIWKAGDSAHEREYQALQQAWAAARYIPKHRLRALADDCETRFQYPNNTGRSRRWRLASMAFAFFISCAAGFAGYQWQQAQPVFTTSIDTGQGERVKTTLPDGSSVHANIQTHMRINYYPDKRIVTLDSGEASFHVAHDATRPFLVNAGHGQVRVIGTQFNVRRDDQEVFITVASGGVEVTSEPTLHTSSSLLTAGMGVKIDAAGRMDAVQSINVAAVTAWHDGKLIFDNQPLSEVVREVTRYRVHPVRIAATSPDLGRLRLSSTFSITDTEALLVALPRILPVTVSVEADGSVEIRRR
jgi:transmembrane sensor